MNVVVVVTPSVSRHRLIMEVVRVLLSPDANTPHRSLAVDRCAYYGSITTIATLLSPWQGSPFITRPNYMHCIFEIVFHEVFSSILQMNLVSLRKRDSRDFKVIRPSDKQKECKFRSAKLEIQINVVR